MPEIEEFDAVALREDLPEHGLLRGQMGTVVMVHTPHDYEVEFVDQEGYTYALLQLSSDKLIRIHRHRPKDVDQI